MRLYRYWACAEQSTKDPQGKPLRLKKWGGSNESVEDAEQLARTALSAVLEKIAANGIKKWRWTPYEYALRHVPEEVIGDITETGGITRNSNGCLVLNTTQAMFVDIDKRFNSGWMGKLFGNTEDKHLAGFQLWMQVHPQMGARVYRTAAGLRYLFTHIPIKVSDEAIVWLQEMKSDPLYIKLCKAQDCYRARLSPKPWRIGLKRPMSKFPRNNAAQQSAFEKWRMEYETKSRSFAVCKFVGSFGNEHIHDELQDIVRNHDLMTMATSNMPLA